MSGARHRFATLRTSERDSTMQSRAAHGTARACLRSVTGTNVSRREWLVHSFGGIPGALLAAQHNDLRDVISVVGAHVRDLVGKLLERGVIHAFYHVLHLGHHLVQLLYGFFPGFVVEFVEGFLVVAAELFRFLAFESLQRTAVPEPQVISELADGVIPFCVFPLGLFGGDAVERYVGGDEPLFARMRAL